MSNYPTSRTIVPIWTTAGIVGTNEARVMRVGESLPFLVSYRNDLAVGRSVHAVESCTVDPIEGLEVEASVVCGGVELWCTATVAGTYTIRLTASYSEGGDQSVTTIRFRVLD
jgi:hypothetical protein